MSAPGDDRDPGLTRRGFLGASLSIGGCLLFGFQLKDASKDAPPPTAFAPDAFIRIDSSGEVTLIMPYVEMGQGVYTAVSMLIAEELEVPLARVRLEHAPADDRRFANPAFGAQVTGASTTIRSAWEPMRRAGATARMLLVEAAARQWQVPASSCAAAAGQVRHRASGRALTYGVLAAAAARVPMPAPEHVVLKTPAQFHLIGTPARRLDAPDKVDGKARFGIDARPAGLRFAALAICPVFGGSLLRVDAGPALKVKGVLQVVRLHDAVAVVASHYGAARKGLALLAPVWKEGPHSTLSSASITHSMAEASKAMGITALRRGDDAAWSVAARKIEAIYELPFLAHAAMEPMNCTVHLRRGHCDIWTGTQVAGRAQAAAAQVAGLAPQQVTVHNHLLGGGFGRRLEVDGVVRAVLVARHVDAPVSVIWSREEDIQHDMYRPYFYDRIAAGLDQQGSPVAWHHRITGSSVLARWAPPAVQNGIDQEVVDGSANMPYAIPNLHVAYVRHEPPGIPTAFWRGVGPAHNVFVVESFIDELAAAAGQDAVQYRQALLQQSPRAAAVLAMAAAKSGWGKAMPKHCGRGIALQSVFGTHMAQVAEIRVGSDGEVLVTRVVCVVDCGIVVNPDTVRAQASSGIIFGLSAALYGAITLKDGRVEQSNFHDVRVVRMNEVPVIDVHLIASLEAPGGMGEPGTSALAPALANAIFAATGKRLRRLPVGKQLAA